MFGNLLVGIWAPSVQVVRLAQTELSEQLDGAGDAGFCELFDELYESVLVTLGQGETLVLNLGLVEHLPPSFIGFLLRVRLVVRAFGGRLVLCRIAPEHRQVLRDLTVRPPFDIVATEEEAIRLANV